MWVRFACTLQLNTSMYKFYRPRDLKIYEYYVIASTFLDNERVLDPR